MQLRISDGEDAAEIEASVKALVNNGWSLREDRLLEKKYYFKNYSKVMVGIIHPFDARSQY
jgi:hypothetical protein